MDVSNTYPRIIMLAWLLKLRVSYAQAMPGCRNRVYRLPLYVSIIIRLPFYGYMLSTDVYYAGYAQSQTSSSAERVPTRPSTAAAFPLCLSSKI